MNSLSFLDAENQEFITEGVLNKTKTAIQLRKIQQVNINQSFIQKLVGCMNWKLIQQEVLQMRLV
jgi:putative membrane protein